MTFLEKIILFFKKIFNPEGYYKWQQEQCEKGMQQFAQSAQTVVTEQEAPEKEYKKKKLMTPTEIKYFHAIQKSVSGNYILQPQVNLATIIERTDEHKYQNELYRNIDFVIFDLQYNPIVLIEINDKTHKEKARQARDSKVKSICALAELPIITFWTDYGINEEYIQKRISEYCTD